MKKLTVNILSLLLSLQISFAPLTAFAGGSDETQQAPGQQEMTPPPAFQEDEILSVPLSIDQLPDALSPEMKQRFAGLQVKLGTREEIEKNRPSLIAKSGNLAVHFTSQYIYFQAVMGLSAMVGLAMNYSNDPIALQNYVKAYTDLGRFGESVGSFGAFLFVDWATGKVLRDVFSMKGPHLATTVQQIGMGMGLLASTVMGEIWNDKNIIICAKSYGTDLVACDGAFDSWVRTNRIVQYIPMIVQNTSSALLSASLTNMVHKGAMTTKSAWASVTGKTAEDKMFAALKKSSAQRFEDGLYLRLSNFGTTGKVVEAIAKRGFIFAADFPGAVIGLGMFMAVDAVVSSPLMKAYTRNYIDEQNTWLSLRKFKDLIGKTSFRPINWMSLNLYAGISSLFPNQFPKIDDDKTRANWINEFNIDTFLKFMKLWAKYNVAARNESGNKSFWNMLSLQPISAVKRDATVVETPQDGFEIMRDAHEAILSSLDFSNKDGWQTYNVDHCSKTLSTASQLTFQQAVQFYIGLNAGEKSCIVDINIYDNLVSYIDHNKQHRDTILAPLLSASKAWTEALTKFLWMTTLSKSTYEAVLKSKFAIEHRKDSYPGRTQKDGKKTSIAVTKLTYPGIESAVKQLESKHQLEAECAPDNEACVDSTKNANDGFLPESFWMNDSVGKARIRNNTDYLIAEMACGPDVKDFSSYWLTAKNYENTVGRVFQAFGSAIEKVYKVFDLSEGVKVFGAAVADPNSAMIYTPAGLYPRFVPPRIVTGNGQLCDGRLKENNSVEKGEWSDGHTSYNGILSFVLGHIKPELMIVNPKNSNFPNFSNWYLANIAPVYNKTIDGFKSNYDQIIHENLRPNLLRDKFTDGCTGGQHCMRSWKTPKVSQGVYQSMEVEMRVLLGLLNEIYIYPTELMAKARDLDDKNPISTSSILREKRRAQLTPEALEMFDTRRSIFIDEANYTNAQHKDENSEVKSVEAGEVRFFDKLGAENKLPVDFEALKTLELKFIRSFKAKMSSTETDKNGPVSFNVEQSDLDLSSLQKFFTQSRVSEINDLQAKVAGLVFRALESLLQERNSYNNLLKVDDHPEIKGDQPQAMGKGANRLIEATKPKDAAKPKVTQ